MLSPVFSNSDAGLYNAVSLSHRLSLLLESALSLQATVNTMIQIKKDSNMLTNIVNIEDDLIRRETNKGKCIVV